MQQDENYYTTSDLALAVILSLSFQVDHLDKSNPKKVQFFFKKDPKMDELIEKYWKKLLRVEPSQYFYQIRTIKNLIYES